MDSLNKPAPFRRQPGESQEDWWDRCRDAEKNGWHRDFEKAADGPPEKEDPLLSMTKEEREALRKSDKANKI